VFLSPGLITRRNEQRARVTTKRSVLSVGISYE